MQWGAGPPHHSPRPPTRRAARPTPADAAEGVANDRSPSLSPSSHAAEACAPAFVTVDNGSNPDFTLLHTEVLDYPGLVRAMAWALAGMGLAVENARLTTDGDGFAQNTVWVTDGGGRGRKLGEAAATLAAERLAEVLTYCSPPPGQAESAAAAALADGTIRLDNGAHPDWTVVDVAAPREDGKGGARPPARAGAKASGGPPASSASLASAGGGGAAILLDVASAISGSGMAIRGAVLQGCTGCGGPSIAGDGATPTTPLDAAGVAAAAAAAGDLATAAAFDPATSRLLRFWVSEPGGGKLASARAAALVYTLNLVLGRGGAPTRPPVPPHAV